MIEVNEEIKVILTSMNNIEIILTGMGIGALLFIFYVIIIKPLFQNPYPDVMGI